MQLCDKASVRQPQATFVLLASHCGGAGGGVLSPRSCLSPSLFLAIPDLDTDFRSWWEPGGAELNWVWGAGHEERAQGWSVVQSWGWGGGPSDG